MGHVAKECRNKEVCFKCGKPGHRQKDCKEIHEVSSSANTGKDKWCLLISMAILKWEEQPSNMLLIAVDSGTEVHIMPAKWVTKHMRLVTGPSMVLRGAGGQSLRHYGRVLVVLKVQENLVSLHFEVVDANRALLSV